MFPRTATIQDPHLRHCKCRTGKAKRTGYQERFQQCLTHHHSWLYIFFKNFYLSVVVVNKASRISESCSTLLNSMQIASSKKAYYHAKHCIAEILYRALKLSLEQFPFLRVATAQCSFISKYFTTRILQEPYSCWQYNIGRNSGFRVA